MDDSLKKLLVIVGASALLFLLLKPKSGKHNKLLNFDFGSKKSFIKKPLMDEQDLANPDLKNAYDCLCAYIDAYNQGDTDSELEAIKEGFRNEFSIDIVTDASGQLCVKDLQGADILVNS